MTMSTLEIVHGGGYQIAVSKQPDAFWQALVDLSTITDATDADYVTRHYSAIQDALDEVPFSVGLARQQAISLGTLPVLLTKEMTDDADDPRPELLNAYLDGIRDGGFGRREARALVGDTISSMAEQMLKGSSYGAYESAKALRRIGKDAKVFGWRDRGIVRAAFRGHGLRHRAGVSVITSALSAPAAAEETS